MDGPLKRNNLQFNVFLSRPGGDYQFQYSEGSTTYTLFINVCKSIGFLKCGEGIAACQQLDPSSPNGQAPLGTVSSGEWRPLQNNPGKNGVTIGYSGGLNGRSFEIDFVCNKKAGNV
jgi:hypothetical protein